MCDMDPTIKLNTSFFQLATISMLCLLEDLIFYSPASSAPFARPLPIFQPIFSFQVSGLTRDLLALLEQLLWFYSILFEVKIFHFNPNFDFLKKLAPRTFLGHFPCDEMGYFIFFGSMLYVMECLDVIRALL